MSIASLRSRPAAMLAELGSIDACPAAAPSPASRVGDRGGRRPRGVTMGASGTDQTILEGRAFYHIYRDAEVETIALRGADITRAAGRWVNVTGPSGSGKSILLSVPAGLMTPSAGRPLLDRQAIEGSSAERYARLAVAGAGVACLASATA